MAQQAALQRIAEKHPNYLRLLPTPVSDAAVKNMMFLRHNLFLGSAADMQELAAAFVKVQRNFAPEGVRAVRREPAPVAAPAPVVEVAPVAATKPIPVGIIGVGVMGQEHARTIAANPALRLAGVADAQQKTHVTWHRNLAASICDCG